MFTCLWQHPRQPLLKLPQPLHVPNAPSSRNPAYPVAVLVEPPGSRSVAIPATLNLFTLGQTGSKPANVSAWLICTRASMCWVVGASAAMSSPLDFFPYRYLNDRSSTGEDKIDDDTIWGVCTMVLGYSRVLGLRVRVVCLRRMCRMRK